MYLSRFLGLVALAAFSAASAPLEFTDAGKELNKEIGEATGGKVQLIFELRSRAEYRPGQAFGLEPNLFADFTRVRFGGTYKPFSWIRFSGVAMDARAPLYGTPAPSSARDPLEWHEGFFEIRPDSKSGFGAIVGRQQVNYGDTRLVGSPQWAYIPRTYDGARAYWRTARLRLEGLFISPVKLDSAHWNKPVLGEHLVGTYNVLQVSKHLSADLYILARRQNRPGGFVGTGTLAVDSFGTRLFGPLGGGYRYSVEALKQTGKIGLLPHRAYAWSAQVGRHFTTQPLDVYAEYKFASGESRSDRSGAFDQLYPAAHDKLGHADVLGWRNVKNWRAQATWTGRPGLTVNLMYNNSWLADPRDAAYNAQGRPIARSATGTAGTHIGQELDLYFTYKRSAWTTGAGYGHLFPGEFIQRTTPGRSPAYAYIFQTYSF
jgi:hypothetical protein